ncbi:GlcNAc-PI de-N-acetylase [Prauserella marina]|uniref:4-oxalomesaconate hydratase n=1 Tax=Prauserella marina TaxID=530584 RepID=A0A222VPR2_9PSEU|nr:PIG-L deacetylase family protein [Prauserella marina]ASR35874.1 GlcNAc-PI de-N-acetylase [Prauserella marina]PWV84208.1 4-oxalomesaconate hydratase [Prauserella marina]SDC28013.1 4-oxalomesaconate hydratase [Prauserella marina]
MSTRKLLVVGAHSADFVWRAAGAVATHTAAGGEALVVALSYGERGESGELWKREGQTEDNVKRIRHEEATKAAAAVGAEFQGFDLGDYPLRVDDAAIERLAELMRDFAPDVVLTHPDKDPFNPDHPVAHAAVARARLLTSGAGVASGFRTAPPSEFLVFEPHQPELCGFLPTVYVDITSVFDRKVEAMSHMAAQRYLQEYYAQRADHRGNHARKVTGNAEIRQAEAFQRLLPNVVGAL